MNAVPSPIFDVHPLVRELLDANTARLQAAFDRGHTPTDAALMGELDSVMWRGVSLGLPAFVDRLAWKVFVKTIVRDGSTLRGWNVRLHQDGALDGNLESWPRPMSSGGRARTFGHYHVTACPTGRLLDYRLGANPKLDPGRQVVDPVVALDPDHNVLLGRSFVALGSWWVPTPSWFVLQRAGPLPEMMWPEAS